MKGKVPPNYPDPAEIIKHTTVNSDMKLSQSRYDLVGALFDSTVTFRHKELIAATKAIYAAEKKLGDRAKTGKANELLDEARHLTWSPVINSVEASDPALIKLFLSNRRDQEILQKVTNISDKWNKQAYANYKQAVILANQASEL